MTNKTNPLLKRGVNALLAGSLLSLASASFAFESGSTGADGAFSPLVDTTLQLPEDGVFNYTTVNIPSGVTVRFAKNVTNTPVVILASDDVTINGTINLIGGDSTNSSAFGDGNLGDDGIPGKGGPGGFDGGQGGTLENPTGGNGLGPGGGFGATQLNNGFGCPGTGAGYAGAGGRDASCSFASVGVAYGNADLQPLIGGSGGGGGRAGSVFGGAGGGGGGGAILIASSGVVNVSGNIHAFGGSSGRTSGVGSGGVGGEGSGGAIRIVATTITGNGQIWAQDSGRNIDNASATFLDSGGGSDGRVKLEAENFTRTATSIPAFVFSGPQPVFLANIPGVRITEVAGIATPASPTGAGDIVIPEATQNPVSIAFATTNIPVGNTVELTVTPQSGARTIVVSNAISGTDENGTASVSVEIPDGPSTLTAAVTFTVAVASLQQDYSQFAQGNTVEKVRVDFDPVKGSMTTFIASNGQEFTWPSNTVAFN